MATRVTAHAMSSTAAPGGCCAVALHIVFLVVLVSGHPRGPIHVALVDAHQSGQAERLSPGGVRYDVKLEPHSVALVRLVRLEELVTRGDLEIALDVDGQ